MESISPIPLDDILARTNIQAWEAIGQLSKLRDQFFVDDEATPISLPGSEEDLLRIRDQAIPNQGRSIEDVVKEAQDIFALRTRINHPRFLTAIPSVTSPLSWLGDLLTSGFNAYSGVWQGGPGIATIEMALISWLADQIGFPASAGGLFVSGGSIANLTALGVARDQILKEDERTKGVAYFSDQTHFCVPKVLRVLGFLDGQMRIIPSDSAFRIDMVELEKAIIADKAKGLVPFVIIGNCGTTNTGAIDSLTEIANLAQEHGMWVHVDGAYGASTVFSKSHRYLLKGLERAHSLAWDAHKWLFQTFGCAIVLVRDKIHLAQSYAATATADFFRDIVEGNDDTPNLFNYGIELTRPARHMRLWFSLRVLGLETFEQMIDHGFMLAATAESELRKLPDWEITSPVTLSVVTFRFCPEGMAPDKVDQINEIIASEAMKSNVAYMLTTRLHGRTSLRTCFTHPQTKRSSIQQLVRQLDELACQNKSGGWILRAKSS